MRAAVLTVSDRSARGDRPDLSGPLAVNLIRECGFETDAPTVVSDGREPVAEALRALCRSGIDVVITTGGTGISPRDLTPEATLDVVETVVPGIAELLRADGRSSTPTAALSRGIAGICGRTLIINLPGSQGAVRDGIASLAPLLPHAVEQLRGADH